MRTCEHCKGHKRIPWARFCKPECRSLYYKAYRARIAKARKKENLPPSFFGGMTRQEAMAWRVDKPTFRRWK